MEASGGGSRATPFGETVLPASGVALRLTRGNALAAFGLAVAMCTSACSSTPPQFGPVYTVGSISDPLVAEVIKQDATSGSTPATTTAHSSASGAEIRGYVLDWVFNDTMVEYVVMKDGAVYSMPFVRGSGARPRTRIGPEPEVEVRSRESAIVSARATLEAVRPDLPSVDPYIYSYIVRIHRVDGSTSDVLVQPDVAPDTLDYGLRLEPIDG